MMKAKTTIGIMVMLMTLAGMTACDNEDNTIENTDTTNPHDVNKVIEIAWKLYGFGTVGEEHVQEVTGRVNYQGVELNYIITFTDEGSFMGRTLNNTFSGHYSIDGNTIVISELDSSMAGETEEGYKLFSVLESGPLQFETKGDQLLVYYNEGQEYILFSKMTHEQEPYEAFLKEGKIWNYTYKNPEGTQCMKSLIVRGDTTINDLAYKKIYDVSSDDYQYALREEGKRVYCKHQDSDTPVLLYDFSKNHGEKVSEEMNQEFRIVERVYEADLVKRGDYLLRRMTVIQYQISLDNTKSDGAKIIGIGRWVEGLGNLYGLDTPFDYGGNYYTFDSCWVGDELFANKGVFGQW